VKFLKLFLLFFLCLNSHASDHIDGAATIANGQADLTDLYAFKSSDNSKLAIILNMYPGLPQRGHFSSKVGYDIFLRKAEENKTPLKVGFKTFVFDELNLNCTFTDPGHHHGNAKAGTIKCFLKKDGKTLEILEGDVGAQIPGKNFKLFSGSRLDPFFLSFKRTEDMIGRVGFTPAPQGSEDNVTHTVNVLSITAEFDVKQLGLEEEMLAIGAQSYTERNGIREFLDRAGRSEITNLSLHDYAGDEPLKRMYNRLHPFENSQNILTPFRNRITENVSAYDLLDANPDWNSEQLQKLTDVLLDDFLILDMSAHCKQGNSFLSIEKNLLFQNREKSCGGRRITDDIMATLTALYIGGPYADLSNYKSGVTVPYQHNPLGKLSEDFPYLAPSGKTDWDRWLFFKAAGFVQE